MRKFFITIAMLFLTVCSYSQEKDIWDFRLPVGLVYNQSNTEFNNTTGIGIYLEPKYFYRDKLVFGYRLEPIALAEGLLVTPGGCTEEHPRYPGIPSCREGSYYLLNNYLFTDYRFGKWKSGKKGGIYQLYTGLSLNIYTHGRYVITSREVGNFRDEKKWITNIGAGLRLGAFLGHFQINLSYNITGKQFQPYFGIGIGYLVVK